MFHFKLYICPPLSGALKAELIKKLKKIDTRYVDYSS